MRIRREAEPGLGEPRFRRLAPRSVLVRVTRVAHRRRILPRGLTILSLTAATAAILPPGIPAASEAAIRRVGVLARPSETTYGANGNLLIDHVGRRAYQATVADDTRLIEHDLDTMRAVGEMHLPRLQPAQTVAGPMDWVWSLDPAHRRLFAFRSEVQDADTGLANYSLLIADLARRTVAAPIRLWPLADRVPLAMSYHAPSDRLYLLTQVKAELFGRSVFWLEERKTDGTLVWEQRESACHGARDSQYAPSLARSVIQPQFVYFNCYNQSLVQAQVIRVRIGPDGQPLGEEAFPAVPGALSTMFDAGSDRFFFLTTNSGAGRGAWVFDGLRSAFLGVIASGDNRVGASDYAMGIDAARGRLYMQTPAGLLVADARRTPLPAGFLFREYAGFGVGLIQVDPVRRRVFVPDPTALSDTGRAERYAIFADEIPTSADPGLGDPDALTLDVAERSGVTDANYSGGARAFALRALTTGGVQKAAWNLALGQFPPDDPSSPALISAWQSLTGLPLDPGNREVFLARIRSTTLTNDAADVAARAVDVDTGTDRDLVNNDAKWPFDPVECHDPRSEDEPPPTSAAGVTTSCDATARTAVASAGGAGAPIEGVAVSGAASNTSITVEQRGIVSRSLGIVTGVNLFDRVWIGTLSAEAEAWAKGRPNTAGGRFTRVFSDVRIDSDGDGGVDYSCDGEVAGLTPRPACDGSMLAGLINRALAGLATVEFPEPDAAYYPKGSRGGYQAVIEKQRFRGYAEKTLNDDDTAEVPAMQLVYFADGRAGRTREVVQLAGVQAEAHYGIYLLPSDVPPPPRPTIAPQPVPTLAPVPHATVPAAPTKGPPPASRSIVERIARRVAAGFGVAVASPRQAALLGALWLFLVLPGYLAWRRRLIGRTP